MTNKQPSWRSDKRTSSDRGYGYAWQQARARYLESHPLCVMCEAEGRVTLAGVVDHIIPHKGDQTLFWDSEKNWQSLCLKHHNVDKAEQEGRHKARAKFDQSGRVVW